MTTSTVLVLSMLSAVSTIINKKPPMIEQMEKYTLGRYPYQVVGIFQTCLNKTKRTALNAKADVSKQSTELAFSYNGFVNRSDAWDKLNTPYDLGENNFTMVIYEICDRKELLLASLDVLLDRKFFVSNKLQNPPKWNNKVIDRWQFEQSVLYLVVYVSEELTKLVDEVMSTADIRIIVTNLYEQPSMQTVIRAKTRLSANKIEDIKNSKKLFDRVVAANGIRSVTVVMFVEPKSHYVHLAKDLVKRMQEQQLCVTVKKVVLGNYTQYLQFLIEIDNSKEFPRVFVLFGEPVEQYSLMVLSFQRKQSNITWVLNDAPFELFFKHVSIPNNTILFNNYLYERSAYDVLIRNNEMIPKFNKVIHLDQETLLLYNKTSLENLFTDIFVDLDFDYLKYFSIIKANELPITNNQKLNIDISSPRKLKGIMDKVFSAGGSFLEIGESKTLKAHTVGSVTSSIPRQNLCVYKACPPGYGRVYGQGQHRSTTSHGWTCGKCSKGLINKYNDYSVCTPCSKHFISNEEGDECIDPYREVYISTDQNVVRIIMVLSIVGSLLSVGVLAVYIKYSKTPLVMATDIVLSCIHLLSFLMIFVIIPTISIVEHSDSHCLMKLYFIGILCSFNLSIIVIKSQKMIKVFTSKTRLSKGDVKWTYISQISIGFVLVLTSLGIVIVTTAFQSPRMIFNENREKLIRIWSCNTGFYIQFQVAFMIFIQLFCFVQAFRARNVPGVYSEAWTILYASFSVFLGFTVFFPVYIFHHKKRLLHEENMAIVLVLVLNFCLLLFVMYGNKVYVILFKAKKNSKSYFREQIMLNVNKGVNEHFAQRAVKNK